MGGWFDSISTDGLFPGSTTPPPTPAGGNFMAQAMVENMSAMMTETETNTEATYTDANGVDYLVNGWFSGVVGNTTIQGQALVSETDAMFDMVASEIEFEITDQTDMLLVGNVLYRVMSTQENNGILHLSLEFGERLAVGRMRQK